MFHCIGTSQTVPRKKEYILIIETNITKGCLFLSVKVFHSYFILDSLISTLIPCCGVLWIRYPRFPESTFVTITGAGMLTFLSGIQYTGNNTPLYYLH
jgi:hypothetical protein